LRKALYRAGDLLQNILYEFRQNAYDLPLQSVEKNSDGKIVLHEAKRDEKVIAVRLPALPGLDDHDKKAVLCFNAGDEALIHMHALVKKTLGGMV